MQPLENPAEIRAATTPSRTNWAGTYCYQAPHLAEPASVPELEHLLPALPHAKAIGTRHSFNHIADTTHTQLGLSHLKTMSLDAEQRTVTVGGGVTYGELAPWLHAQGFALHNLASLPHISVAGSCATATHGSGLGNGCLATAVQAVDLIDARGRSLHLTRTAEPERLGMAAVGLGALGVVTSLTLDVVPTFQVAQTVFENLSFDVLEHSLEDIFRAAYSVSLFTDWQHHRATQVWLKQKLNGTGAVAAPTTFYGATRQTHQLHPLPGLSAEHCTEQQGRAGPWYERLPHFRLDYTPSAGAEIQSECFVPLNRGYDALLAVEALRDQISPHLLISELRTVAADDMPMSMAYGRDSLAFHFTWKPDLAAVRSLLPALEAQLAPFAARPHWAKLFTLSPVQVRALYPRFGAFTAFVRQLDPEGKFRNAFLAELLGD